MPILQSTTWPNPPTVDRYLAGQGQGRGDLVDIQYPDAERIVLVQDNLNTHPPASLYAVFGPGEAKRLADRLELHYSPGRAAG